jgi:hypothetical protein
LKKLFSSTDDTFSDGNNGKTGNTIHALLNTSATNQSQGGNTTP